MSYQPTTTISWTKNSTTKQRLDEVRGQMPVSTAIRILLDYILSQSDDYVKSIIGNSKPLEKKIVQQEANPV